MVSDGPLTLRLRRSKFKHLAQIYVTALSEFMHNSLIPRLTFFLHNQLRREMP